jgi:excisionase family DNA binding protein
MRMIVCSADSPVSSRGHVRHPQETELFGGGPDPWKTGDVSTDQPRFLKLTDVADVLNVTTRQVYALVRSGDLRGIQVGGRNQWRVEDVELEDYIQRQYAKSDDRDAEQAR